MKIKLKCKQCQETIYKEKGEVNRQIKKGRASDHFFCNNSCASKYDHKHNPEPNKIKLQKMKNNHPGPVILTDEYSPFRYHFTRAKNSDKNFDITLKYLKDLWETQEGRCPYTGWKLIIHRCSGDKMPRTPDRASLDRIDNSKGYIKGNVEFISYMAQMAKYIFSKEDVLQFCKDVVKTQST